MATSAHATRIALIAIILQIGLATSAHSVEHTFGFAAVKNNSHLQIRAGMGVLPRLKRLVLRNGGDRVNTPSLSSLTGPDFRDVPRFVRSIVGGQSSDIRRAHAIANEIKRLSFNDAWLPPTLDPLKSLTGYGGGFCLHQSYSFQMLASVAGLRVRTCGHNYGSAHVTNEVMINRKWRMFDLSLNVEADTSFEEIAKNPVPFEMGDAYGQASSGTTADRFIRALYSGETKCFEFKVASDSQHSTQSFDLDKGEMVSFDFPQLNPSDPNDDGMGKGAFERSLTVGSTQLATAVLIPWPIHTISVLGSTRLDPYVIEISLDRGVTWKRLIPSADDPQRAVLSVAEPESLRGPPLEAKPGSERHGDLQRSLNEKPSFRFDFKNYGYEVRVTPPEGSVRTSLTIKTGFSFNPAAMPQLKQGDNELVYRDDGVFGKRNVGIEATWVVEPMRPVQMIPLASRVTLSAGENVTSPPRLVSDTEGRLHLTFAVDTDQGSRVAYRRFEAGAWSDIQLVSPTGWSARMPDLAADGSGGVQIVFAADGIYTVSIDRDFNVRKPEVITHDPDARNPSVAFRDAVSVVAWEGLTARSREASGTEIVFVKIGQRETVEVHGHEYPNFGNPRIAITPLKTILLTGTKGPRYLVALDLSGARLSAQYLTTDRKMFNSRGGDLTVGDDGSICAAFDARIRGTASEIYLRCSNDGGRTWGDLRPISQNDQIPSFYPALEMLTDKMGVLAWMSEDKKAAITVRTLGANDTNDFVVSGAGKMAYPDVAWSRYNSWVVWQEKTKGKTSIMGANLHFSDTNPMPNRDRSSRTQ